MHSPNSFPLPKHKKVIALSGGVGGAKLALGLANVLSFEQLVVVANTADDFEHLGLSISPDLDTVMYTLAGLNDQQRGWGLAGESWQMLETLKQLGGETWFQLGDKDLATHLERTQSLGRGESLSRITQRLCRQLAVQHSLLPMSDDPVRTRLKTDIGELAFQEYFVREQCKPTVREFFFAGIEQARPQAEVLRLLQSDELAAIIICPSNPFVSVEPILQLPGIRTAMKNNAAPVIAVSPIVAGAAIKGPAAKMMQELAMPVTAKTVAEYYGDLLDGFIVDQSDAALLPELERLACRITSTPTIMKTLDDRIDLARSVLCFAEQLNLLTKSGAE